VYQPIKDNGADRNAQNNVFEIPDTRVPPQALVQAKWKKNETPDYDEPKQHLKIHLEVVCGDAAIEPEPKCQIIGQDYQADVKQKNRNSPIGEQYLL
jgi:hypothetical protein